MANFPPAKKPAIAIAIFCKNNASKAPTKPNTSATVKANTGDGSCTKCGANSTPAANPTAATQSQNNLRPKKRMSAPSRAPMIGTEAFTYMNSVIIGQLALSDSPVISTGVENAACGDAAGWSAGRDHDLGRSDENGRAFRQNAS